MTTMLAEAMREVAVVGLPITRIERRTPTSDFYFVGFLDGDAIEVEVPDLDPALVHCLLPIAAVVGGLIANT